MVLHMMVMKFLLQTMVTSKGSIKFYGMVNDSLTNFKVHKNTRLQERLRVLPMQEL
ncbi:unnamed protein product [Brassica oleracea var. botrytis]